MKTVFRNEPKIDADNPSLHGNLSLECGWNYDGEQINFRHIETVALKRDAVLMVVEIFKALESVWKIDPTSTHEVDFDAHIVSNPDPDSYPYTRAIIHYDGRCVIERYDQTPEGESVIDGVFHIVRSADNVNH